MVGVEFDQAGHDEVATGIFAACGTASFTELCDAAVGDSHPAALDHAIGEHDAGVTEDRFLRRHLTSLSSCGGSKRRHIYDAVGDQMADFVVMDDRHHRDLVPLL